MVHSFYLISIFLRVFINWLKRPWSHLTSLGCPVEVITRAALTDCFTVANIPHSNQCCHYHPPSRGIKATSLICSPWTGWVSIALQTGLPSVCQAWLQKRHRFNSLAAASRGKSYHLHSWKLAAMLRTQSLDNRRHLSVSGQRQFTDGLAEVFSADVTQPHVTFSELKQLSTHRQTRSRQTGDLHSSLGRAQTTVYTQTNT